MTSSASQMVVEKAPLWINQGIKVKEQLELLFSRLDIKFSNINILQN